MMKIVATVLILVFFLTACATEIGPYIDLVGIVVGEDGQPIEDATVAVFIDEIEIARFQTQPLENGNCYVSGVTSERIGYGCYNFLYRIPRFADFDLDNSSSHLDVLANARFMKAGEQVIFRSIDGRFLVIAALDVQPPRNVLLLQPDNTMVTPLPDQVVATPRFSSQLMEITRTVSPTGLDLAEESAEEQPDFVNDWVRPFVVSFLAALVPALLVFAYLEYMRRKENQNAVRSPKGTNRVTVKKTEDNPYRSFMIALAVQAFGSVLGTIMLKVIGLA